MSGQPFHVAVPPRAVGDGRLPGGLRGPAWPAGLPSCSRRLFLVVPAPPAAGVSARRDRDVGRPRPPRSAAWPAL